MVLHQTQLAHSSHSTVTVLLQSQCVVPDIICQISCSLFLAGGRCVTSVSVCQCVCLFGLSLSIYIYIYYYMLLIACVVIAAQFQSSESQFITF
jgi:hypothetical protein